MHDSQEPHRFPDSLTQEDLDYLRIMGKKPSEAQHEYLSLLKGTPHRRLRRPCSFGDGILRLEAMEHEELSARFASEADGGRASVFVVASGAASRMFSSQQAYLARMTVRRSELLAEKAQGRQEAEELLRFFDNLHRFPFFDHLRAALASRGYAIEKLLVDGSYGEILDCLLSAGGLGYGNAPKGLIAFHAYPEGPRTAFEEHLVEAAAYVRDREGKVRVHFTIPPGEDGRAERHLSRAVVRLADAGTRFAVSLSVQDRSTDSIAADCNYSIVRDETGRPRLWPSGHGALLNNLHELCGDIVFVRTIDNILPDRLKGNVVHYKRILGGLLIKLQERVFEILRELSTGSLEDKKVREAEEWGRVALNLRFPQGYRDADRAQRRRMLYRMLHRPLRVCAMVRHKDEAGGRPFWVEGPDGNEILQIVEHAEADMSSPHQRALWEASDFFNPADLVCGMRDHHGRPYDLVAYADATARFVSLKRHRGQEIRVLERPGLWNGSMAFWNTVFVEVPKTTLHPVKNVIDLLSPEHQA